MFRLFCILVVSPCVFSANLWAQKRVSKQLLDPQVTSILVEGEQCFRVVLETGDTREVRVEAAMEGEYENALLVQTEVLGSTLRISTGFSPDFDLPNDKLGAHKVFSVDLRVILPSYQQVTLYAGQCEVRTYGRYRSLKARSDGGTIQLEHEAEHTEVQTHSAEIEAHVRAGSVEAISRYGKVELGEVPNGASEYLLESIRGNIRVRPKA